MKRSLVTAIGTLVFMAACAPAAPVHDMSADMAGVTKVRDAYMAALKAGNAAGLGALYTADAQSMGNAQPSAVGPQGVEAAMKGLFAQMNAEITITPGKTEIVGDVAYEHGTYKTTMTPKAGGAPMVEDGRYVVILRRQADNSWKLAEEISNLPTAPMAMAMPAPPPAKKK